MENGYQTFAEAYRDCCAVACTRLAYERQQTDPDYAVRAQECETLYKQIAERLGAESRLMNDFDAAKNHVLAFDDAHIYQQGFQDCVYLLRWIGLL